MITSEVMIVGGGLGGLSAALALVRAGMDVVVLEAAQAPMPDYWGFVLWPPGTRTLQWLGVLDEVKADGCRLETYRWYAADGREWASTNLNNLREAGDWVGILPSKLHSILEREARLAGVKILQGVADIKISRESDGLMKARFTRGGEEVVVTARLVIGADGPQSRVRQMIGTRSLRWRPPGQVIVTGIGGGLKFAELRQAVGDGWSGGCVTLGDSKSWIFATIRRKSKERGIQSLRAYGVLDPQAEHATAQLSDVIEVSPWSVRVWKWAADGIILIGDAAHPLLPHLGLGGSMTLEDIPVLTGIVRQALRTGDTSAARLSEFQKLRRWRISYARRVSEMWALSMTSRLPGMSMMRDLNFWRISKHPEMMEAFLREMAGAETPTLRTRLKVLLP